LRRRPKKGKRKLISFSLKSKHSIKKSIKSVWLLIEEKLFNKDPKPNFFMMTQKKSIIITCVKWKIWPLGKRTLKVRLFLINSRTTIIIPSSKIIIILLSKTTKAKLNFQLKISRTTINTNSLSIPMSSGWGEITIKSILSLTLNWEELLTLSYKNSIILTTRPIKLFCIISRQEIAFLRESFKKTSRFVLRFLLIEKMEVSLKSQQV